ncbi:MAG: hypothetical protein ACTSR8_06595 [Promethearchaeota archaeon]
MDILKNAPLSVNPITGAAKQPTPKPTTQPVAQSPYKTTTTPNSVGMTATSLGEQLDTIVNNLGVWNTNQIVEALTTFQNSYTQQVGYSAVLKQVGMTVTQMQGKASYNSKELGNKIKFWRKKLHI